ncbi:MAG: DUF721 domain-containing protein [Candidatus Omnitrophica bacterium]|nr:DUF721 domain-containing protein [Candidatus Omnitrophota bacterium]
MRENKKIKPVAIKELIDQFFKEHKKAGESLQSLIIEKWQQIMPENANKHSKPITIKNKTLIIAVSNSAWLHQLTLKKIEILNTIKDMLNTEDIIDIRFKIGK